MRIADWRGAEIRCSLPVLLTLPTAVLFNCIDGYLTAFFSLMLHELAHSFMARRLGYSLAALEIQPFGFVARLIDAPSSPSEAAAIYASGPLISLLLALLSAGLMYITGKDLTALRQFSFFNLVLGIINLIPVLPLDGGRLLSALLAKTNPSKKITKLFSVFGIGFGIVCVSLGTFLIIRGTKNFTLIVTGFFIALAAARELKTTAFTNTKAKLNRLARLRRGNSSLRVYAAAINCRNTVREAFGALSGGGYNVVLLTDAKGKICGVLDETEITDALALGKADKSLYEIYSRKMSIVNDQ